MAALHYCSRCEGPTRTAHSLILDIVDLAENPPVDRGWWVVFGLEEFPRGQIRRRQLEAAKRLTLFGEVIREKVDCSDVAGALSVDLIHLGRCLSELTESYDILIVSLVALSVLGNEFEECKVHWRLVQYLCCAYLHLN